MIQSFWFYVFLSLVLAVAYISHIVLLAKRIRKTSRDYFWPKKWLVLAIFPFLGWCLYRKAKEAVNDQITLLLPDIESTHQQSSNLHFGWILFQEQYDRKSGDHQGTSIHMLNKESYSLTSYTHEPDDEFASSSSEIVIPYPGKRTHLRPERFLWASLIRKGSNWLIQNERNHTIIPVFETLHDDNLKEGTVRLCRPRDQILTSLNNGDCFIVHTTEFRVFELPPLALYNITVHEMKILVSLLYEKAIHLNEKASIVPADEALLSFIGNVVSVTSQVIYHSVMFGSRNLTTKELGQAKYVLPLYPGDTFESGDRSMKLLVDYPDPQIT